MIIKKGVKLKDDVHNLNAALYRKQKLSTIRKCSKETLQRLSRPLSRKMVGKYEKIEPTRTVMKHPSIWGKKLTEKIQKSDADVPKWTLSSPSLPKVMVSEDEEHEGEEEEEEEEEDDYEFESEISETELEESEVEEGGDEAESAVSQTLEQDTTTTETIATKAHQKKKKKIVVKSRKKVIKQIKVMARQIGKFQKEMKQREVEKNKIFNFWDSATERLLKVEQNLSNLRRKYVEAIEHQNTGTFHDAWRAMNMTRLLREEAHRTRIHQLDSWVKKVVDEQRDQGYYLFKQIKDETENQFSIATDFISECVKIRKEATERLTDEFTEATDKLEANDFRCQTEYRETYYKLMDQLQEEVKSIVANREDRLNKTFEDNAQELETLLLLYNEIISHNFVEIRLATQKVNDVRHDFLRVRKQRDHLLEYYDGLKLRYKFLKEHKSSIKRKVFSGREIRDNVANAMKLQGELNFKKDIEYINKKWYTSLKHRLDQEAEEKTDKLVRNYFQTKRDTYKSICLSARRVKQRSLQVQNYRKAIRDIWDFKVEPKGVTFERSTQLGEPDGVVSVSIGDFTPFTVERIEKLFEPCAESFNTAIVFFGRRLSQNCLTLDDLQFFIRRQQPTSNTRLIQQKQQALAQKLNQGIYSSTDVFPK